MARAGRDHPSFKHGLFEGYRSYRYGEQSTPVTLAKAKPIFDHNRRKHLVGRVAEVMSDWHLSRFEQEGPCRHGLRQALCLEGHPWRRSNDEAAAIVEDAAKSLGLRRPTWEEGQPDFVNGTDYCSWCHGPMDDDSMSRKQRFCSVECATMAVEHRNRSSKEYVGVVLRSAQRLITKSKAPPRACLYCGTMFQSDREDTRCCSGSCAMRWKTGDRFLKDIVCEGCGKTCKPHKRGARFCSRSCSTANRHADLRSRFASVVRQCKSCGSNFHPSSEINVFCSPRCKRANGMRTYEAKRPVHHFTCQCCGNSFASHRQDAQCCSRQCSGVLLLWSNGKARRLTPRVFDYMLRLGGARITEEWREAA